MDHDERDPDLLREVYEQRRGRARSRRHATAWDEPPEYHDDDRVPPICPRCGETWVDDGGCRDPACPTTEPTP